MNFASSAVQIQALVCKCVCEDIYTWTWVETDPCLAHRQIPELSKMVSVAIHLSARSGYSSVSTGGGQSRTVGRSLTRAVSQTQANLDDKKFGLKLLAHPKKQTGMHV